MQCESPRIKSACLVVEGDPGYSLTIHDPFAVWVTALEVIRSLDFPPLASPEDYTTTKDIFQNSSSCVHDTACRDKDHITT